MNGANEKRTVKVLREDKWVEIPFSDLRERDTFRLYDDKERTKLVQDDNGYNTFIALSDPYWEKENLLAVKTEPIKMDN